MTRNTDAFAAATEAMRRFVPDETSLRDRVVLVTGASGGLGREVAKQCAAAGATVVLLGRDQKTLDAVYDDIEAAGGPLPMLAYVDQLGATVDDYELVAASIEDQFGRLDGVVHAAAMLGDPATFTSYSPLQWAQVMQVNVNSVFLMTQALMRVLHLSEDASIVFVSDAVGRAGRAYWGAYAVSKFALEGMMQILADELASMPTIRVNTFDPGPMRTRLRAAAYPGELPNSVPEPAEVVPQIVYLLSGASTGVNGLALRGRD